MRPLTPPPPQAEEKQRAAQQFTKLQAAMKVLGVSGEEQKALWLILGAVYHLGAAGATKGRRTTETPRLKTREFLGRIPLFQGKKTWIQTCQIKRPKDELRFSAPPAGGSLRPQKHPDNSRSHFWDLAGTFGVKSRDFLEIKAWKRRLQTGSNATLT